MSHFKPQVRSQVADTYQDNNSRMEGNKASFSAALMTSESCMGKCNLSQESDQLSAPESECLRQCFVKYFDCRMLVQNELTNFARGLEL